MRVIDGDAFDAVLASAEVKARNQRKYVLQGAINMIRGNLKRMPTIEPERKIGKWMDTENYYQRWKCSVCGCHTRDAKPPYCSHCGARMEA